jgi:LysM repeat protein
MLKSIALAALALPFTLSAANRAQEYEQVRKIAQRDPKVRAAYEAADRKLAERIVEIDPTLRGYKPGQPEPKAKAPAPAPKTKTAAAKPTPKPAPAPKVRGAKHKVAQGETLESIATKYRVGVPTLKQANPGVQERRLQVGQVIVIPQKSTITTASNKAKPSTKPAEKSWWEKLAE